MNATLTHEFDPALDLILERFVDAPPEKLWEAWTNPEMLKKWFTPAPWATAHAEIDLRPGGVFRTVMRGPEGEEFDGKGCYLEVVPNRKLVWTSALGPGYRPNVGGESGEQAAFVFTAVISFEPHENGTKYSALVIHGNPSAKNQHEEMGFHNGWGAALDQLVELLK